MEKALFGSRLPLSRSEYNQIYQETGLDVDGRKEFFVRMIPVMDNAITEYVEWVKEIPGFMDLPLCDQIKLLRGNNNNNNNIDAYSL